MAVGGNGGSVGGATTRVHGTRKPIASAIGSVSEWAIRRDVALKALPEGWPVAHVSLIRFMMLKDRGVACKVTLEWALDVRGGEVVGLALMCV